MWEASDQAVELFVNDFDGVVGVYIEFASAVNCLAHGDRAPIVSVC